MSEMKVVLLQAFKIIMKLSYFFMRLLPRLDTQAKLKLAWMSLPPNSLKMENMT
jgi:hypothetical protein